MAPRLTAALLALVAIAFGAGIAIERVRFYEQRAKLLITYQDAVELVEHRLAGLDAARFIVECKR